MEILNHRALNWLLPGHVETQLLLSASKSKQYDAQNVVEQVTLLAVQADKFRTADYPSKVLITSMNCKSRHIKIVDFHGKERS